MYHVPANLGSGLHSAVVVHLQVIKVTVHMVLQVKGFKRQPNQVAWGNTDVPGTAGPMGVVGGVARACDSARRNGQGIPTTWCQKNRTIGQLYRSLGNLDGRVRRHSLSRILN